MRARAEWLGVGEAADSCYFVHPDVELCFGTEILQEFCAILVPFHVGAKVVSWSGESRFMEGGPDVVVGGEGVCIVGESRQRIEASEGLLIIEVVLYC